MSHQWEIFHIQQLILLTFFLVDRVIEAWWIENFWQFNNSFDKELSTPQKNHILPQQSGTSSPCWSCTVVGWRLILQPAFSQVSQHGCVYCVVRPARTAQSSWWIVRLRSWGWDLLGASPLHLFHPQIVQISQKLALLCRIEHYAGEFNQHIWYVKRPSVIYTPNCQCDGHWSGFTIV